MIEHKLQSIIPAGTLDPEAQIISPEPQLGPVKARLRVQFLGVLLLREESLRDDFLRSGDLGAQPVAVCGSTVTLRCYRGNGSAHFGRFDDFFTERVRVRRGFLGENLDFFPLQALIFCLVQRRGGLSAGAFLPTVFKGDGEVTGEELALEFGHIDSELVALF